jgi:hypothetical protein
LNATGVNPHLVWLRVRELTPADRSRGGDHSSGIR